MMAETKPADFFIGLTEFFAVLLPGATLVYFAYRWAGQRVAPALPSETTQAWAVFLVLAYIGGHLLHALSSGLDTLYDRVYLPFRRPVHYQALLLKEQKGLDPLRREKNLSFTLVARAAFQTGANGAGTSLYDWCLSLVRLKSASAAAEVDQLQADSKFFRSLSLVLLAVSTTAVVDYRTASVLALLLSSFSIYRFCDLRWTATKRVYEYYLLLHRYSSPDAVITNEYEPN
jgi:hypothetical protein